MSHGNQAFLRLMTRLKALCVLLALSFPLHGTDIRETEETIFLPTRTYEQHQDSLKQYSQNFLLSAASFCIFSKYVGEENPLCNTLQIVSGVKTIINSYLAFHELEMLDHLSDNRDNPAFLIKSLLYIALGYGSLFSIGADAPYNFVFEICGAYFLVSGGFNTTQYVINKIMSKFSNDPTSSSVR